MFEYLGLVQLLIDPFKEGNRSILFLCFVSGSINETKLSTSTLPPAFEHSNHFVYLTCTI